MDKQKSTRPVIAVKRSDRAKVSKNVKVSGSKSVECKCYTSCSRCK